ncbi:MAG: 16S rRNA (guanine(527)-N(7))-methyltransferase RsmG [Pseudomonadota bacterium]
MAAVQVSHLPELIVSRETWDDFKALEALVVTWSSKINLVSKQSVADLSTRHIADSAQLWPLLQSFQSIADFGSGGGFPGLVLAICAKYQRPEMAITLVESDRRKCVFLQTAARELALNVKVISQRIETLPPLDAPAITARALASCNQLFGYAAPHLLPTGSLYLLKGERADEEIAEARHHWQFSVKKHQSKTHPNAVILEVGDLNRV